MTYGQRRNPSLPWGYWLHADGGGWPPLVDEDGRRWENVRQAFWIGRLGFEGCDLFRMEADLERLLAVLGAMDLRVVHVAERRTDLFEGERRFAFFHDQWLVAQGLVAPMLSGPVLTAEGHAVLLMLAATRPSQVRAVPVGTAAVETMWPRDPSDPEVAAWLGRVEEFSATLPFRFVRREFRDRPAVALVGEALGGDLPIRRTLWQQSFSDRGVRDRFHLWLAVRIDRWERWGAMAHGKGAGHLTQHFLALAAETMPVGGEDARPARRLP